jgi:DNA-binding NarL/FixJ family response regulator
VVEDHPMLASVLIEVIEREPDLTIGSVARTGADAVRIATQEPTSVLLVDYRLSNMRGTAIAGMIRTARPELPIVVYSGDETEEAILDAIDAGASAYLTRSATADRIVEAVTGAARGEVLIPVNLLAKAVARQRRRAAEAWQRQKLLADFTPRELEVLREVAKGLDTVGIARELGIAPNTVDWHVRHLIGKLQVHSKLQAVVAAARLGLIDL